jgi:hypothetical protein
VQPKIPPGLVTRNISSAASWLVGANIAPKTESTRSKEPSSKGRSAASPSTHSISTPASLARARPASKSSGVMSEPVTFAPRSAARIATLPEPVPMSSTSWPSATPTRSTSASATGWIVSATVGQSPEDQTALWPLRKSSLNAINNLPVCRLSTSR